MTGRAVDLGEVCAEESLLGASGPLREPDELALGERGNLAVDVEPGTVGGEWSEVEGDEPQSPGHGHSVPCIRTLTSGARMSGVVNLREMLEV